jgi:hypothetical protein
MMALIKYPTPRHRTKHIRLGGHLILTALLLVGGSILNASAHSCDKIDRQTLAKALAVEQRLIPYMHLEIPSCNHVQLHDGHASFILTDQDSMINNGVRSEFTFDYPFREGDMIEYRWAMMLPSVNTPGSRAARWWVVAQWHDQPNPRLGETWPTFRPKPPPVAIFVEQRQGVIGIGIQDEHAIKHSWSPVPLDVWLDVSVVIHWSTRTNGWALMTVNGQRRFPHRYDGRTMLNNYQHFLKLGQYRAPGVGSRSVVNMKAVQIQKIDP